MLLLFSKSVLFSYKKGVKKKTKIAGKKIIKIFLAC